LIRYLQYCKRSQQRATVESARAFMALRAPFMESVQAKRLLGVSMLATWKEALNWFFKEVGKRTEDRSQEQKSDNTLTPQQRRGGLGQPALPTAR
jgi:hypothetical protein